MNAHTPGPWAVDPTVSSGEVMTAHGYAIHEHPTYSSITDTKEIQANARLIAAAPELLLALQELMNTDGGDLRWFSARAAIAKATGETK